MKLHYVHWDNFRYLTGMDKKFAHVVNDVLAEADKDSGGEIAALSRGMRTGTITANLPPFMLAVERDAETGAHSYGVFPMGGTDELDDAYAQGVERYGDKGGGWSVMLIVKSGERRSQIVVPLAAIVAGSRDVSSLHQVYSHIYVTDEDGSSIKGAAYIGVTRRGWRTRWAEHVRSAERGSRYRFHQAIRHWHDRVKVVSHHVIGVGMSEAEAMAMEEQMVGFETLYPKGLNMIPGGYAGLKYLRQTGAVGAHERVTPDDKQEVVNRFFETASRRGLPNPLAAANWCDPSYAEKVICAGDDRLKPDQIRNARFLASLGKSADVIAAEIGARNKPQVQRLLSGSTYSRVA